ncbi:cytochrome b [Chelativorans sp. ZYF759]|uniref:cytochrome b n=1 Tax=Chelativorans sp. ZYF759 TaxID=2692213 RepID=UPI00210F9DD0|nr:cytochrome b/b6 domain-containing protein [Chelativorans sp. ZYF759]
MRWLPDAARQHARFRAGYSVHQRAMHWTILLLCLIQVPTSWAIRRTHLAHPAAEPEPFDLFLHEVHAWSGWLILALALGQLTLRLVFGRPTSHDDGSPLVRWGSVAAHWTLYGLLIALPITGTVAMYVTFRVAPIHSLLSWALLVIVLIHVAAALWHHFYRRDDVLRRMIGGVR